MNVPESLNLLKSKAKNDKDLRKKLLATQNGENQLTSFCKLSTEAGVPLSAIDIIEYGENAYAAMRRSTNGGGENSPMLDGEDDYYELFMAELRELDRDEQK